MDAQERELERKATQEGDERAALEWVRWRIRAGTDFLEPLWELLARSNHEAMAEAVTLGVRRLAGTMGRDLWITKPQVGEAITEILSFHGSVHWEQSNKLIFTWIKPASFDAGGGLGRQRYPITTLLLAIHGDNMVMGIRCLRTLPAANAYWHNRPSTLLPGDVWAHFDNRVVRTGSANETPVGKLSGKTFAIYRAQLEEWCAPGLDKVIAPVSYVKTRFNHLLLMEGKAPFVCVSCGKTASPDRTFWTGNPLEWAEARPCCSVECVQARHRWEATRFTNSQPTRWQRHNATITDLRRISPETHGEWLKREREHRKAEGESTRLPKETPRAPRVLPDNRLG